MAESTDEEDQPIEEWIRSELREAYSELLDRLFYADYPFLVELNGWEPKHGWWDDCFDDKGQSKEARSNG